MKNLLHNQKRFIYQRKVLLIFLILMGQFNVYSQKQNRNSYKSHKADGNTVLVETDSFTLALQFYSPQIVKVAYLQKGIKEEESPAVILKPKSNFKIKANDEGNILKISSDSIGMVVEKSPFSITFNKAKNPLLKQLFSPNLTNTEKSLKFTIQPQDHYFGLGQKGIDVDRKGYKLIMENKHIGGYSKPTIQQQISVPFLHSPLGYGLFFDNQYPSIFDLGESDINTWKYEVSNGPLVYFFIQGNTSEKIMTSYYELTGFAPIPPKWALGYLQSKCSYNNQKHVEEVVDKFTKKNIPVDAIILDAPWFGGYTPELQGSLGNLSWKKENFPDHLKMTQDLHKKGIKLILISEPFFNRTSTTFQELSKKNFLVKKEGENKPFVIDPYWAAPSGLFDITNPKAQEWLWSKYKALIDQGADGMWTDLGEPEVTITNGQFYGGDEKKIHNIYNNLWAKTIYDGYKKDFPDRRILNLTRAGYAGIQRYSAQNWSGDASKTFAALRMQVPMLCGMVSSGIPYFSSDIGGFTNIHDVEDGNTILTGTKSYLETPSELYIRWIEFGTFSPIMRPHSGEEQSCEPFAFDEQTEKITSDYVRLRYKLLPYIYSYANKTFTKGESLIKPLFFLFPNDEKTFSINDQYMFGNEMMVAPVLEQGATGRTVYLPGGSNVNWINLWSGKKYSGGRSIVAESSLGKMQIPVFVKEGSIFPLAKVKKHEGETPDDTLALRFYPGGSSSFELYEDDGNSNGYMKGEYATTQIESLKDDKEIKAKVFPVKGSYKGMINERVWQMEFYLPKAPTHVMVNGNINSPLSELSELKNKSGYYYDKNKKILSLNVKSALSKEVNVLIK